MEPTKANHTSSSALTSSKDSTPFFSFNQSESSTVPFFHPNPTTASADHSLIQRTPEAEGVTSSEPTEEEIDAEIKQEEILDEFPGIEEALPQDLVDELALFFVQYDQEIARRDQLPILPWTYQLTSERSNKEMGSLIYHLRESMYNGDAADVEDVLECCYIRLNLFEVETDIFEKMVALEIGRILQMFSEIILQNLRKLQAKFRELELSLADLKKLLEKAEGNVRGAQIDMALGLLMDGASLAIKITNPWIGVAFEIGKFAASRYIDDKFGPDVEGFLDDLGPYNDAAGGSLDLAEGYAERAKGMSPAMNSAVKKLGKGSFILGNILDINEIKVAYDQKGEVANRLADVDAKFKEIAKLYELVGGEYFIERIRMTSKAFIGRIKIVEGDLRRLEYELQAGFPQFYEQCKGITPEQ